MDLEGFRDCGCLVSSPGPNSDTQRLNDRGQTENREKECYYFGKKIFFLSKILLFLIETTPGEADIYETSISNSNIFFSKP